MSHVLRIIIDRNAQTKFVDDKKQFKGTANGNRVGMKIVRVDLSSETFWSEIFLQFYWTTSRMEHSHKTIVRWLFN